MIFEEPWGLKLFISQARENYGKKLNQETCPDRGSNPGPLHERHERRACYRLLHSSGLVNTVIIIIIIIIIIIK